MKVNLLIAMFLILGLQLSFAQNAKTELPISKKVEKVLAKDQITSFEIATTATTNLRSVGIASDDLGKGKILDLNLDALNSILTSDFSAVSLSLPLPDKDNVKVNLVKNKVLTDDFILRQSSNREGFVDYKPGKYFMGTIENDPSSLVSFSIFNEEIIGLVHTKKGNYVIGKLDNTDKHIVYKDSELKNDFELDCGTQDDGVVYKNEELTVHDTRNAGDCVRVHIEIDDDIVTNKGGTTGATNYITGVMNEVITLYANDGISMIISEIFAWDTPAPYSGNSSSAMLNSYESNTGAFNGDLSHLVSYQASGGIASGFSGLCNPNVDERKCFSSISGSYSTVPTYSFTVMVMTHEMGHLLGSRHTHACVWNGNGTAIDGCAGGTEGGCSLPGSPPSGGTIMSYCHLTTGIDFTQGFGSQPRAVVLNSIANASCTSSCSGGPTCTDGTQNGDETGVDCGGTSCPPCSSTCDDNEVNVNITFDNYPEETSWTLKNSSGTTVASGGTYGSQPDGSSLTIEACVVDGCYDFTINDSYGDGICCSYGNGSYSVTDAGGTVLASGGSFTSSETTNFCFGDPGPVLGCTDASAHNYDSNATQDDGSCETCTDGVQNGDETGVDCGGALCNACPTGSNEIFAHYFESGWDGWADGGSDCFRYSGTRSYEGSYSIRLRDNSGTASSMTSSSYNMGGYTSADLKFYFYANSMENGEDFWVQVNTGSGWQTVATYARGTSFDNNIFYTSTVNITNLGSNTQFRFRCDASANGDQVYIDQVTLTGNTGSSFVEDIVTIDQLGDVEDSGDAFEELAEVDLGDNDLMIYPNPVLNELNVMAADEMSQIHIYSYDGALLKTISANDDTKKVDISGMTAGFYILRVNTPEGWISKKFVKK